MEKLGLNECREKYLRFFEEKGHLRMPSFSLVPQNDASLLLINAGMAPLKPFFTGKEQPPKSRVTTCQKCIRTPDIERVGKTARHGTFFEMLGNFSFGDYFKKEAIAWAWEFSTQVIGLPVDRIHISVYEKDDEAYDIWTRCIGVEPSHVKRMGKEENFWEIGTGPCGPCSELHFDRGEKYGCGDPDCALGCDCDRYIEFWNLVFTQFDKDEGGNYNRLENPNIDTGMGLERLAVILQDVNNLFEVDTIRNIMNKVSEFAGVTYKENEKTDVSLRVITDHIRSTVFLISDGVIPSNEGRGYVLRRLLRRGARHGKLLGISGTFLHKIVNTVIAESGQAYPEIAQEQDYIKKVIKIEEERFIETIDAGLAILESYIQKLKQNGETVIDGDIVFKLYDTYGFPADLTLDIAKESDIDVDEDGFVSEMEKQKQRARQARQNGDNAAWQDDILDEIQTQPTVFLGYDQAICEGKILAMVKDGEQISLANTGEHIAIITDQTVFYGEGGGQCGDRGRMIADGVIVEITDTKKRADAKYVHVGQVTDGAVKQDMNITLEIDQLYRSAVMRNHSATHLLQKALTQVLGDHVHQAGSFVSGKELRFDFTHFEAMTPDEIELTERYVNDAVLAAMNINIEMMDIDDAKKTGAKALFGEKYGQTVRVVSMGDYSNELCGGTHLTNTAQVGLFKIVSEGGIAAGTRRIEAVTGKGVLDYIKQNDQIIRGIAGTLKVTNTQELPKKVQDVINEHKTMMRIADQLKSQLASSMASDVMASFKDVNGVKVVTGSKTDMDIDNLKKIGDTIKSKHPDEAAVMVMAAIEDNKVTFVAMATQKAVARGVHVGKIIKEVAMITGGNGGGKPDMAQAGGKFLDKVDNALAIVDEMIADQTK